MFNVVMLTALLLSQPALEKTPEGVISLFRAHWDSLKDYTCIVESYERLGEKEDFHVYDFRYMKPGWIWMKILKGKNKGSQVSYNPHTNKVRAKKGGILGVVKLTLDPSNKRVVSIRGYQVNQSDFGFHLKRWEEYLGKYTITVKMDTIDGKEAIRLDATGIDPDKYGETYSESIWLSPENFLMLKLEARDKNGVVFHRAVYKNVKINQGLTEEDFKI